MPDVSLEQDSAPERDPWSVTAAIGKDASEIGINPRLDLPCARLIAQQMRGEKLSWQKGRAALVDMLVNREKLLPAFAAVQQEKSGAIISAAIIERRPQRHLSVAAQAFRRERAELPVTMKSGETERGIGLRAAQNSFAAGHEKCALEDAAVQRGQS